MFGKDPGYNILQLASIGGYSDVVIKYISKSKLEFFESPGIGLRNIDSKTPKEYTNEYTSAHLSIIHGNLDVLEILLSHNAHLEQKDKLGKQPIHYAAEAGNKDLIQVILEKEKRNIDQIDYVCKTPLHYATEKGNIECIDMLIKNGAKLNIQDIFKR